MRIHKKYEKMATIQTLYLGDLRTEITHVQSGNKVMTDAPTDNNGKGEGFSPTDLCATALASCAMTIIGIYGRNHGVDVTGTTIGKGFAGAIKRHHFSSNRASHGNSVTTRAPGSIGNRQDPGRVFPGKRMAGHLGAAQRTTQNLVVARVDAERGLLLVRGAVPGSKGGEVIVRPAVKA